MNKRVREHLIKYCEKEGLDDNEGFAKSEINDDMFRKVLGNAFPLFQVLLDKTTSKMYTVVEVGGMYIAFESIFYYPSEEENILDLSTVCEVVGDINIEVTQIPTYSEKRINLEFNI